MDWLLILLYTAVGFLLIKLFYPYPALVSDSYDYLAMAYHMNAGQIFNPLRPCGYPYFLRFIHLFSGSVWAVIIAQGLIYAFSLTLLFLAVKKYWPPKRVWAFRLTETLAVLSPTALYLLNSILSDPLFCCLVFFLVTMAMVMIKEQSWAALALYLTAFYAAIFFRYSAEFFPLAFIPVFAAYGKRGMRIASVVLTLAVVGLFIFQMRDIMDKNTGYRQASTGFEGWQLANNAVHILPYIPEPTEEELPKDEDVAFMHKYLYGQFDWYIKRATSDGHYASADFMWDPSGPLKKMHEYCVKGYKMQPLSVWIDMGTHALKQYAVWLILKYPKEFIWYYLWPNTKNAFFPAHAEAVYTYIDMKAGREEVVNWFSFPSDKAMEPRSNALADFIQPKLAWIELFTWFIFLFGAGYWFFTGYTPSRENLMVLLMILLFGFIYYGTTVFASPIALRYWMPMHAVKIVFAWIAIHAKP